MYLIKHILKVVNMMNLFTLSSRILKPYKVMSKPVSIEIKSVNESKVVIINYHNMFNLRLCSVTL